MTRRPLLLPLLLLLALVVGQTQRLAVPAWSSDAVWRTTIADAGEAVLDAIAEVGDTGLPSGLDGPDDGVAQDGSTRPDHRAAPALPPATASTFNPPTSESYWATAPPLTA